MKACVVSAASIAARQRSSAARSVVVEPRRGHLGRDRLEDPAHLMQLEQRRAGQQVADEAHARQQELGLEARHVGAVADARLEHADQRERAHRLAQRVAREAEALGEVLLVRELGARR